MKHEISRIRHELVRRSLVIRHKEFVTPKMLRLTLAGDELQGFTSLASDDHIKMFAASEDGSAERRDYTPRRYDAEKNELIVDFAIHEAGPVTAWARAAKVGDTAEIGGPRGSLVVPQDFDWWLLIGDETALPAIGRWIEELPRSAPVTSLVSVTGSEEEEHSFASKAAHRALWVHRPAAQADDPAPLLAALKRLELPPGDGFIWIAAEGTVARALRRHVLEEMRHPMSWLKASGYWVKGRADVSEKLEH